jgi:hypothetical protein
MKITDTIFSEATRLKSIIRDRFCEGDIEGGLQSVYEHWMFLNRFRNCDLGYYFDEEIQDLVLSSNKASQIRRPPLDLETGKIRIAFIVGSFSDTGGASVPDRFMCFDEDIAKDWEQYFLVVNHSNSASPYKETNGYRTVSQFVAPEHFTYLGEGYSLLERALAIEEWLKKHLIDVVFFAPCPSTLYAIGSRPCRIHAAMSQDCYTYTLGPGSADVTFLVTNDQLFKYKFKNSEHKKQVIFLPLHSQIYRDSAPEIDLAMIPEGSVVSASSNIWKASFGDGSAFFQCLIDVAYMNPSFHHVFVGTSRGYDEMLSFLAKHPKVKHQFHYIGPVKNIYSILKKIDFWINTFPTSGGSTIEAAFCGIPSVELIWNRNLTLHPVEFMCCWETQAIDSRQFVLITNKLIRDTEYRLNLGNYLADRVSNEFGSNLVKSRLYGYLKELLFTQDESKQPKNPSFEKSGQLAIEIEKYIGVYNQIICREAIDRRFVFLQEMFSNFGWTSFYAIKILENLIWVEDKAKCREFISSAAERFTGHIGFSVLCDLSSYRLSLEISSDVKTGLDGLTAIDSLDVADYNRWLQVRPKVWDFESSLIEAPDPIVMFFQESRSFIYNY